MMSRYLFAAALSIPAAALAAPPHVHGLATLDVALDGPTLSLHLESPLDNLVGFEHPAYNPSQKQALDGMVARLNQPGTLFVPSPAAGCIAQAPVLTSAALEAQAGMATHKHAHADMDADFSFRCAHPDRLTGMEVRLIEAFPRTHQVRVQVAGPHGQSALVLEAGKTRVGF